jgi:hypothetical protein
LRRFEGKLIIQTMFLRGIFQGVSFDNTTDNEVSIWITLLQKIKPKSVMIYSLARDTPAEGLVGISLKELEAIGNRVEMETHIPVQISG